ncbi:MAG TPA: hypothetical protein VF548_05715 [Allosphingosinicella sp.]|jgi:hypothetical protein
MVQLYRRKGADTLVNTETSSHQSAADVAVLPGGGYVVTWADSSTIGGDPTGVAIKAQRFDSQGNRLGSEFLVNGTIAGDQFGPTIAASDRADSSSPGPIRATPAAIRGAMRSAGRFSRRTAPGPGASSSSIRRPIPTSRIRGSPGSRAAVSR